ncbi:hypothetical protein Back11_44500 [Paenibacillus baekrokdamisoli]|uniref:Uncharacterized protein n=1 Tax=Paenibacillus baekrokdamisoli TaxID=1712516 RepID=A0A3G9J429_9BACL|nr:hypothetical protein Back11_44500 [Paenibacillus baekrokdamisoli]
MTKFPTARYSKVSQGEAQGTIRTNGSKAKIQNLMRLWIFCNRVLVY